MTTFSFFSKTAALAALVVSAGAWISTPASAEIAESKNAKNILVADDHTGGEAMDSDTMNPDAMDSDAMDSDAMGSSMSSSTIVDIASGSESFETLVQALESADLVSTLAGAGPYTVFAPTDAAFAALPDGALEFLLLPENEDLLTQVLTYHVVPGEVSSGDLSTGGVSALGGGLAIGVYESGVVVNNASVTQADIQASNGIIHQINRVLVPSALQQQLSARLGVSSLY